MISIHSAAAALFVGLGMHAAAGAVQHTGAPASPGSPQTSASSDRAAGKSADATYRAARRACQELKESDQKACLRKARTERSSAPKKDTQRADGAGAGNRAAGKPSRATEAVQTQSSEVSATGAAPPAVDRRTPGTPATPTK